MELKLEKVQILWDRDKCTGCSACVHACPQQAISISGEDVCIDFHKCVGCLECVHSCPSGALSFEGTDVHNELIVENLKWAMEQGIEVLPRIPVIPGFNESLDDAAGIASLLQQVGANKVQLLPFHQFGENKYHKLGLSYAYENITALHEEDLQDYRQVFLDQGIEAFF